VKRFVDLGTQLSSGDDGPREFAWWDTVVDKFEEHSGYQTWLSWGDFVDDYEGDQLERYRSLCPDWVFLV
jgi:hypothetical protein